MQKMSLKKVRNWPQMIMPTVFATAGLISPNFAFAVFVATHKDIDNFIVHSKIL